jgi:AraC family transcriptional regulator
VKSNSIRREYLSRINRVLDFIENNIDKELNLEQLAEIGNFSPFHFHRVFSSVVNETLYKFIQRVRLERAAWKLLDNKEIPVADIAYDHGFSSPAVFARAFKDYYNMSATDWRMGGYLKYSKKGKAERNLCNTVSNNDKETGLSTPYFCIELINNYPESMWSVEMRSETKLTANVEVKEVGEMTVAYIRHIGPYAGDEALFQRLFGKLFQWAGPRGLIRFPETKSICIYHDNPDITEEDKLRLSVCITVPKDTKVDGEVNLMTIPAAKYAIGHFEIFSSQYGDAWQAVYGGWMPESGYQPDDGPCFEMYLNDPKQHPEGKHIVDIYAPVKPL